MDITKNWNKIRQHFNKSFSTSLHVSIGSVDEKNQPCVTPVGTLFLNGDQSGFYFEKYVTKIQKHSQNNKNICILGVNSSSWFWVKSLFKGKFDHYPGVKLYGQLGIRRKASEKELSRLRRRMRWTKSLKGHQYLWDDMPYVREIFFTRAEMINLYQMTRHLKV